jgi:membrane associated rhomboid family serine protease
VLLLAILAGFGYGIYQAYQLGVAQAFIAFNPLGGRVAPQVIEALDRNGSLRGVDLLHGQWYRLFTAMFVHAGAIHLIFNLWMLGSAGWRGERMWGPVRLLLIFFLSGFCSSCIAVAQQPLLPQMGASGALCGLLGAEIVWVLLNGRYLPADLRKQWRFGLVMNFVLIAVMGFLPGVSNWGHAAGAVAGAVVGVLLNFHRFAPSPWRWLAVPLLASLPVFCVMPIDYYRRTSAQWGEVEESDFKDSYKKKSDAAIKEAEQVLRDVNRLQRTEPRERDDARARDAVKRLETTLPRLTEVQSLLDRAAYRNPRVNDLVKDERWKVVGVEEKLREAQTEYLASEQKVYQDEQTFEDKYVPILGRLVRSDHDFLVKQVHPLIATGAKDRPAKAVSAARERLEKLDAEVSGADGLYHKLEKLRYCRDEVDLEALRVGKEYLDALGDYCQLARRFLQGSANVSETDKEDLNKSMRKMETAAARLEDLLKRGK